MKSLFFIVLSLVVSGASADQVLNSKGVPLAGRVVSASPLCPADVMCVTNGTVLNIEFEMNNGCMSLGPVNYSIISNDDVEVEAIGLLPQSPDLMCPAVMVYERSQMTFVNIYPPFKVSFKGTAVGVEVNEYTEK